MGRRGLSRRNDSQECSSGESKSGDEQDRRSSREHPSSSGSKKKKLKLIRPINDLFIKARNYMNYCLANRSARYDSSMASMILRTQKS